MILSHGRLPILRLRTFPNGRSVAGGPNELLMNGLVLEGSHF
jgi:hypothetical protein